MAYASVIQIWSRWAPPNERAKMAAISDMGVYAGLASSFLISGWILYELGWAMLFHITGTISNHLHIAFGQFVQQI